MSEPKPESEKTENEGAEVEHIEEFTADEIPFIPSYQFKMQEFFLKSNIDENEPVYYLYRFENDKSAKKQLIDKFSNISPPDEHEIGLEHGSGKYLLILVIPPNEQYKKGTSRGYQFYVGEVYDERRRKTHRFRNVYEPETIPPPPPPVVVDQKNNFLDTVSIIEKIVTMVTPLLVARTEQKQPDFTGIVRDGYKAISEVMQQSMMENFKMIQQVQKRQLNLIDPPKEDTPEPPGIIQQFLPLLAEWLPKLMGNDMQSKMTGNLIKNIPQIKDIVNDSQKLNDIVGYLVQTEGVEATKQILNNLGIPFSEENQIDYDQEFIQDEIEGGDSNGVLNSDPSKETPVQKQQGV